MSHLIWMGWIEVWVPLHSSPTNFGLKSGRIFDGLFGYHGMVEVCNCSILLDQAGEK
jgi:hypothetical protein